jgi:thiol:disulfide interchange protein DsbD
MLRRIFFTFSFASFALLVSACSGGSNGSKTAPPAGVQAPASSVKFVQAQVAEVQIPAGGSAEATVKLTIQSGYHVNANPPTFAYLRPTEVSVQTTEGLSVGFITYPKPLTKQFSFAEKPLAVYEGEAEIKLLLKATAAAAKGARSLPAKLNVQACDDQVCYPPGTLDLSIPANIK